MIAGCAHFVPIADDRDEDQHARARDELLAERQALNRLMADEPDQRTNANFARRDAIDRALRRDVQPAEQVKATRCQGPGCFVDFEPTRKGQRYHCEACKKRAKRAREGADSRLRFVPRDTHPTNHPGNAKEGTNRRIGMRGFEADFGPSLQIGDSGAQRA